jgi:uncharacterized protein (TIGR03086 family)
MATESLEKAFADTRQVLANVKPDQLDLPSPCASWKVRHIIDHIVGGSQWFGASMAAGKSPEYDPDEMPKFADRDYMAEFDKGVADSIAAFGAPGAQEKMVTLPFGTMPGGAFMGLATTDTFTHGWDVAKATGQSTDIDPELAEQLLAGSKMAIQDAFRGEDGKAPFGPEQQAPAGASAADRLAAFLGRKV